MNRSIRFVGLDVHKELISVAIADEGRDGNISSFGEITNTPAAVNKLTKRLLTGDECDLCFVYEAGCFGFILYRQLTALGHSCVVAAPSLIPRKPGDRVKTDRRDALNLARLLRAGDLTACHIPDESDEAMRDLVRARGDAVKASRVSRQVLGGFLLRHGIRFEGKTRWGPAYMRWISELKMPHPAQYVVLEEYRQRVVHDMERVDALTKEIERLINGWRWEPVVCALQTLRGLKLINAVTVIAEMGDLRRFSHPRQLMAALGLVPSEHSSGGKRRQGGITKTGNGHARKALIEAAWNYRYPARMSATIERRQHKGDKATRTIAWNAQKRLCGRYNQLDMRGKNKKLITTAVARELCGFIWDIAQQVMVDGCHG